MSTPTRPRFHHAEPGTAEPAWLLDARWARTPLVDVAALAQAFEVLVVAAHPDDETLAVGGLLAAVHGYGGRVRVLVASDGEASHPGSSAWTPAMLAAVRRGEVLAAVEALAPGAAVECLGLPDGALADHEDLVAAAVADRCGPGTLVLAPWTDDGHPDHDAVGRAARDAAARVGARHALYPLWLWHWGGPDDLDWAAAHVVELTPADLRAKTAALGAYPSQTGPLGPGPEDAPVVTPPVLRRAARTVEVLLADPGALPVRRPRRDADVAAPFDAMYDAGEDPWSFTVSFYERRKRDLTAAVLGRDRYRRVLEVGCAGGVLTRVLADRADAVVAVDVSARALDEARRGAPAAVDWRVGRAPQAVPTGPFDLVVLSEVGYFLTPVELLETLRRVRAALTPGGEVVLVHWRHPTTGVPLDGEAVHAQAAAALADLPRRAAYEDADVLVEVWGGPVSVAAAEGRR